MVTTMLVLGEVCFAELRTHELIGPRQLFLFTPPLRRQMQLGSGRRLHLTKLHRPCSSCSKLLPRPMLLRRRHRHLRRRRIAGLLRRLRTLRRHRIVGLRLLRWLRRHLRRHRMAGLRLLRLLRHLLCLRRLRHGRRLRHLRQRDGCHHP